MIIMFQGKRAAGERILRSYTSKIIDFVVQIDLTIPAIPPNRPNSQHTIPPSLRPTTFGRGLGGNGSLQDSVRGETSGGKRSCGPLSGGKYFPPSPLLGGNI